MKPIVKHIIYATIAVTLNIIIYFILLKYISNYTFLIYSILMYISFGILSYLFCSKYLVMYARTMLDERIDFKPSLDKPRIFINSLFIPFLIFMILCFNKDNYSNYTLLNIIYLTLFIVGSYILVLSWTKEFEGWFIKEIRKVFKKLEKTDFEIHLSNTSLEKLYERLIYSGFLLDEEDFEKSLENKKIFVEVFASGKLPIKPIFHLTMENLETAYFFNHLFSFSNKLNRPKCIRIFRYPDRLIITKNLATELSDAKGLSQGPFKIKEIDDLFIDLSR